VDATKLLAPPKGKAAAANEPSNPPSEQTPPELEPAKGKTSPKNRTRKMKDSLTALADQVRAAAGGTKKSDVQEKETADKAKAALEEAGATVTLK